MAGSRNVTLVVTLGGKTHGALIEGAREAVEHHRVDDALVAELREAASESGELFWPMPLPDELRATINSGIADIANANPGVAAGGMLLAGVFLREFVGAVGAQPDDGEEAPRIPWAHLDIAGSEENKGGPYGFTGKGGTGVAVRLLVRHAERLAERSKA